MKVFKTQKELKNHLQNYVDQSTGFVPTMGALHRGHLSLLIKAKAQCDIVICSIFVNPTQFNEKSDFDNYPILIDEDIDLLKSVGCDILYLPETKEDVYQHETEFSVDLGILDKIMEGVNRPGHFDGVMRVVKLLLEIVEPTKAYFGLKDYQQYLIIKEMSTQLGLSTEIIGCDTIREADDLAMSSRNLLLTLPQRQVATTLIKTLKYCKEHINTAPIDVMENRCLAMMRQYGTPEYFVIRRADTLEKVTEDYKGEVRAFVVCKIGNVRLIDNLQVR
jgi:pantoate--beta-alanine ligase